MARNIAAPPGMAPIISARAREKPDCVRPQAIAVAVPMIRSIEPESEAVCTSIGPSRRQSNCR